MDTIYALTGDEVAGLLSAMHNADAGIAATMLVARCTGLKLSDAHRLRKYIDTVLDEYNANVPDPMAELSQLDHVKWQGMMAARRALVATMLAEGAATLRTDKEES